MKTILLLLTLSLIGCAPKVPQKIEPDFNPDVFYQIYYIWGEDTLNIKEY
jgi:hypothetical protein